MAKFKRVEFHDWQCRCPRRGNDHDYYQDGCDAYRQDQCDEEHCPSWNELEDCNCEED